jgi:hypothetical protein
MAVPTTVQIANLKLTAEKPETSGDFVKTLKTWFESTKGAFDFMQLIKKVSCLCGNEHLETQAKRYIGGTALMRVPTTALTIRETVKAYQKDKVINAQRRCDFAHQVVDCGTMLAYSSAFFCQNPVKPLKAAAVLGLANDATDMASAAVKIKSGWGWKQRLVTASPALQRANHNTLINSLLKLIKSVTGLATGIFAAFVLFTGTVLISPTIAVTIALASSIFSILTHYHNNYWCDTFLKVEYMPTKIA